MASYTRQSSFADGDTITAALFNNEFNQLVNAFHNSTGHKHDGTAAEGPVIGLIGDAGETAPNNKVLIDTTNNFVEFYVQVASAPVQQLYIADGAIIPVTDSDIDLGTSSLYFKNAYIDSITTTGNVDVGGNLTVTGTTTFNGGTITMGDAATDNVVFGADVDSNIIPDDDDTYDLGSASQEWRNLYIDGTANIDSLVADTADINGGTIDGVTIGGTTAGAVTFTDLSDGTITITAFADEDDMSSDSATLVPTQQSVKAYVDSQVTAGGLDFQGDTGGALSIDLDSESLTIAGGTGLDTVGSGNTITVNIDSTVATLTGTQTLTNKTLTTPVISSISNTGTITLPTSTDTLVGRATTDTLTNKTIDVDNNTVSNIEVDNLKAGVLDTDLSSVAATDTTLASAKAIKTYVDAQVTAQDLDLTDGTTTIAIDLDSETLSVLGGTGVTSTASGNGVTLAIGQAVGATDNVSFGTVTAALTGNASTATALATARTIGGVSFDGTANIVPTTFAASTFSGDLNVDSGVLFVDVSTNRVGINQTVPDVSLDLGANTDAIHVPSGTTGERPGSPAAGYLRYNSTTGDFEGYTDAWGAIAGAGGTAPAIDTMTGDDSDTTLTLTSAPVNENATVVTIDGVVQHKDTYSVSGNTLTFSTAPPTGTAVECITWTNTAINSALLMQDADGDTQIQVEESSDEDKIRFDTAGTERMVIDNSGNVQITNTNAFLSFGADATDPNNGAIGRAESANYHVTGSAVGDLTVRAGASKSIVFGTAGSLGAVSTERMRLDASGNVLVGTTSSVNNSLLNVNGGINTISGIVGTLTSDSFIFNGQTNPHYGINFDATGGRPIGISGYSGIAFATSGTERMRIDSSGNVLVGKLSLGGVATVGAELRGTDGYIIATSSSDKSGWFGRNSTDGDIVGFYKDGTTVGSIGSALGLYLYLTNGDTGLKFVNVDNSIRPANGGNDRDNAIDLGTSGARFDDIYATTGTIQTSDRNEKQDIEALTDAETRVAVAAKGLLRKYRWKSAVAKKGNEARTHFGIIAQDLQDAFTAEGLDAGDYAMFISGTWTDDDGVEQTRLGVRYSELLAFIIAAI